MDGMAVEVTEHPGDTMTTEQAADGLYWHQGQVPAICGCGGWLVELYAWQERLA